MKVTKKRETEKRLLDIQDIRQEYGLGRQTCYLVLRLMPTVRVGSRYMVRREDLEAYLEQAAREGRDIRAEALAATRRSKTPAGAGGGR
ncbi:hypothetical protein Mesil_1344 [Allomeiothermus silvanus DSM 9946]|uniref:Helix-turn-helix domain-containing protein n=1 Tax=Allomeiothermus silvanus (strain ATCC 700542 / DSM 9946 / NBRC 106475 / NCIMB 13440 / VI-R2) TaxID=526227 RepID=D7BEJ4_ALLS1|nr:hypothetical protein [Allomeiothermus silvanus]ADH63237.1 hypothetical protein Mesil_1344 [Allomeiothermus silvanus DSM 9946]